MIQQFQTTNYMTPYVFYNKFLFWLVRLQPFINETGRPPMNADSFCRLFRVLYGCGLRVTEGISLEKRDIDLNHGLVTIRKPKTGHKKKFRTDGTVVDNVQSQRTTILPYDIPMLEKHIDQLSSNDKLFPVNRHIVWQYGKDAGNLAGLNIGEIQGNKIIDGVWNHLMRKSCSKRMQELGASRELRMLKLRHVFRDAHDAYDVADINALKNFEVLHFSNFALQKVGDGIRNCQ